MLLLLLKLAFMTLVRGHFSFEDIFFEKKFSFASFKILQMYVGIGAGLESMTVNPMAWEGSVNPKVCYSLFLVVFVGHENLIVTCSAF